MTCPSIRSSLRRLLRDATQPNSTAQAIPTFLAPGLLQSIPSTRPFSTSTPSRSRIGGAEITLPPDVSLRIYDLPRSKLKSRNPDAPSRAVDIAGPLGQMTLPLPAYVNTSYNESSKKLSVSVLDASDTHQRAMWGTTRAHLANSVSGVSEGHVCILRMVGVGYRATIESSSSTLTKQAEEYPGQQFVSLKLGYAHPIEMGVPKGVRASTPQPTRILLEGCDKQVVAEFAAKIREWRKPEPYKGKGIFVNDETIRMKAKKIK